MVHTVDEQERSYSPGVILLGKCACVTHQELWKQPMNNEWVSEDGGGVCH